MTKRRYTSQPGTLNAFTKAELDSMTVSIEFTLISLAQGLALAQLATSAIEPVSLLGVATWPYSAAGLLLILYFWTQGILHALCFINWPISLRHNFIYFLFMTVEILLFSQIASPERWFAYSLVFSVVAWLFYWTNLGLIRGRASDFITPAQKTLYAEVTANHRIALRVWIPIWMLYLFGSWLAIFLVPDLFLAQGWHFGLIVGQLLMGSIALWRTIMSFHRHADIMCDIKNPRF